MARPKKLVTTLRPLVETPERLQQAGGAIVDTPTERAGFPARRVQPAWERLMVKDIIDPRQAGAAAAYAIAFENMSRAGYPPSLLARLEVGIGLGGSGSPSRPLADKVIEAIRRFRAMSAAVGDDRPLIDGVIIADLTPHAKWQVVRLRAALDRVAVTIGL